MIFLIHCLTHMCLFSPPMSLICCVLFTHFLSLILKFTFNLFNFWMNFCYFCFSFAHSLNLIYFFLDLLVSHRFHCSLFIKKHLVIRKVSTTIILRSKSNSIWNKPQKPRGNQFGIWGLSSVFPLFLNFTYPLFEHNRIINYSNIDFLNIKIYLI